LAVTIEENTTMPSPHQIVVADHGSKSALIDKVVGLAEPMDGESADEHKRRLRNVSNAKLLHLASIGEKAKALGGRDAMVKKILELKGQSKDHEFGDALKTRSLGQLIDMMASVERRVSGKAKRKPKSQRPKKG
jgi:hypothetical protein